MTKSSEAETLKISLHNNSISFIYSVMILPEGLAKQLRRTKLEELTFSRSKLMMDLFLLFRIKRRWSVLCKMNSKKNPRICRL